MITLNAEQARWAIEALANMAIEGRDQEAAAHSIDILAKMSEAGIGTAANLVLVDLVDVYNS